MPFREGKAELGVIRTMPTHHPSTKEFYARVSRCPILRTQADVWTVDFFPVRRICIEVVAVMGLVVVVTWLLVRPSIWPVVLTAFPVLLVYAVDLWLMWKRSLGLRTEIRGGQVWLGHERPICIEPIVSLICVQLSGVDDPEHTESGSSRLYMNVGRGESTVVCPLMISSHDLSELGSMIADALGVPFRIVWGPTGVVDERSVARCESIGETREDWDE